MGGRGRLSLGGQLCVKAGLGRLISGSDFFRLELYQKVRIPCVGKQERVREIVIRHQHKFRNQQQSISYLYPLKELLVPFLSHF